MDSINKDYLDDIFDVIIHYYYFKLLQVYLVNRLVKKKDFYMNDLSNK